MIRRRREISRLKGSTSPVDDIVADLGQGLEPFEHDTGEGFGVSDGIGGGEELGVLGISQESPGHEDILALCVARLLTALNV